MEYGSTQKNQKVLALTEAQDQVLKFIKERCDLTGISPSYREIQSHLGYKAVGTVQDHVKALIKKGFLETAEKNDDGRKARHLLPVGFRVERLKQIPIYGEIAAGSARDSVQLPLGSLGISHELAQDPCFALRVVGNSMIDVGILEGDLLIVERKANVKSGDIVVALLEGETTVKRYVERGGKIFLVPENTRMKPITVTTENFSVQGKVVGLQRRI